MRHRKIRILLLCFLCVGALSGAKSLQFGWISVVEAPHARYFPPTLFEMIAAYGQTVEFSDHYEDLYKQRILQTEKKSFLEEKHRKIKQLDGVVPQIEMTPPSPPLSDETSFDVVWQQIDVAPSLAQAITASDATVIDYILALHNLDYLFVCSINYFDAFLRVRMVTYHRFHYEGVVLYDGLTLPEELSKLKGEVFLASISSLSPQSLGLLHILNSIPGLALSADDREIAMYDRFLPLAEGMHDLSFTSQGFNPVEQEVFVQAGQIKTLALAMERISGPPLLVTSFTHTPEVTITQGPRGALPLIWPSQQTPFSLYGYQKGLLPTIRQYNSPLEHIELTLHPPWMHSAGAVARSQKSVYASFGRTLLLGATAIVLDALSRSLSTTTYWQPLVWGALGGVVLSSIETGAQLFAYYQKTKYSSQ